MSPRGLLGRFNCRCRFGPVVYLNCCPPLLSSSAHAAPHKPAAQKRLSAAVPAGGRMSTLVPALCQGSMWFSPVVDVTTSWIPRGRSIHSRRLCSAGDGQAIPGLVVNRGEDTKRKSMHAKLCEINRIRILRAGRKCVNCSFCALVPSGKSLL